MAAFMEVRLESPENLLHSFSLANCRKVKVFPDPFAPITTAIGAFVLKSETRLVNGLILRKSVISPVSA